jgi:hypothetical protein
MLVPGNSRSFKENRMITITTFAACEVNTADDAHVFLWTKLIKQADANG